MRREAARTSRSLPHPQIGPACDRPPPPAQGAAHKACAGRRVFTSRGQDRQILHGRAPPAAPPRAPPLSGSQADARRRSSACCFELSTAQSSHAMQENRSLWVAAQSIDIIGKSFNPLPTCTKGGNNQGGHYTALNWSDSTDLGCGTAITLKGSPYTVTVCHYANKKGNVWQTMDGRTGEIKTKTVDERKKVVKCTEPLSLDDRDGGLFKC